MRIPKISAGPANDNKYHYNSMSIMVPATPSSGKIHNMIVEHKYENTQLLAAIIGMKRITSNNTKDN